MRSAADRTLLVALALILSGCATTTVVRSEQTLMRVPATYEVKEHFFFWGFVRGKVGEVALDTLCLGKDVNEIQVEHTSENILYTVLTLGIYTPNTVRVWCGI